MTITFLNKRIEQQYQYLSELQNRTDISKERRSELGFSALQQLEYYENQKLQMKPKKESFWQRSFKYLFEDVIIK
jgi:REP element-mobilizing transposase RayT